MRLRGDAVHKSRRPKFELTLKIIDLNNIPLVTGHSLAKWHLPSSTAAEHNGMTPKELVKDHKVLWNYTKTLVVRLAMDKTNMLQECLINFEVFQDYSSNGKGEKVMLGRVSVNLAEYVEAGRYVGDGSLDDGEEGVVVRRYLMQESKINSTLKLGIGMVQVDGERNWIAPPLKTAPVFGGIAGIISSEQNVEGQGDDIGPSRTAFESDLQSIYRLSLAASWGSQPGELPPDACIESIFSGGTGWSLAYADDATPDTESTAPERPPPEDAGGSGVSGGGGPGGSGGLGRKKTSASTRSAVSSRSLWRSHGERAVTALGTGLGDGNGNAGVLGLESHPQSGVGQREGEWRLGRHHAPGHHGSRGHSRKGSTDTTETGRKGSSGEEETSTSGGSGREGEGRRAREVEEGDVRDDLRAWVVGGVSGGPAE